MLKVKGVSGDRGNMFSFGCHFVCIEMDHIPVYKHPKNVPNHMFLSTYTLSAKIASKMYPEKMLTNASVVMAML